MSTEALCASLQEFNAVINLVDNNGTGSGYPILERNIISSDIPSHDKVNRQISAMAFNSLSSFSRGTFSKRGCNQAADMILTPTYRIKKQKMEVLHI